MLWLFLLDILQPLDPMALKTAMQHRTSQVRDLQLQGAEAVIKPGQRMVLERYNPAASSAAISTAERRSVFPVLMSSSVPRLHRRLRLDVCLEA